jgi:hypothetical protein
MLDLTQRTPNLQSSVMCLGLEETLAPTLKYLFFELPVPDLPHEVNFCIVNVWINGRGDFAQSVRILNTKRSETLVFTGDQPFTLTDPATPQMMTNEIVGLKLTDVGQYWVQVSLDGNSILEYPFTVSLKKQTATIDIYLPNPAARITQFPPGGGGLTP